MYRRDFLDFSRLLATRTEPAPDTELLRVSRRAMATKFEVVLPCGTTKGLAAAEAALEQIDRLEDQLSVYREHSEVSQLNRRAAQGPVPVEQRLFDLLALAQRLHQETDGAFDITVAALIKEWGFFGRAGRVPSHAERPKGVTRVGMQPVVLDAENRTVLL